MISVIFSITGRQGFENFKETVVHELPDLSRKGVNTLCLVNDKNLYLECRDFLQNAILETEILTHYVEDKNPLVRASDLLAKDKYVFIVNENIVLPSGALRKLYRAFVEYPFAGFMAGHLTDYNVEYWVENVYMDYSPTKRCNKSLTGMVEIDTCIPYAILTKSILFKELFFEKPIGDYGSLSFGVRLRRKGYRNFVLGNVKVKHGGKE